jgi:RNA polymerase sigma-70 factor, ECF subfamily
MSMMKDRKLIRPGDVSDEALRELVVRAREGDKRAYGRIFRACYEDIYDYIIRKVGNRTDAEDLTMHVFANGLKAIGEYEERGLSIRAWLYRIAHNAIVDHLRSQKPQVEIDETVHGIVDTIDVAEEMLSREEIKDIYREILALPDAQSEVLLLRFMKDLSVSETALVLDKKEVTVRALQFKGIKNLREKLRTEPPRPLRGFDEADETVRRDDSL